MNEFRCCAIVPTFDNPETIRRVVEEIRSQVPDVLVVDDGSAAAGREACDALARAGLARVFRLEKNRGKGAAVQRGLREAAAAGFTHAFQIDADGQHDLGEIPRFLAAARESPDCAIFGAPLYDESAPAMRRVGREITRFWVDLETGRGTVQDAMVGFRVYPVAETLALPSRAHRMAFDVEIAVLLAWGGVRILNLPVKIRYLSAEEGGRSHFRPFQDNLRLSWLHTRLCTTAVIRWLFGWLPRLALASRS
jgi:glycosyltransferase involved in cell wall biosynthesis